MYLKVYEKVLTLKFCHCWLIYIYIYMIKTNNSKCVSYDVKAIWYSYSFYHQTLCFERHRHKYSYYVKICFFLFYYQDFFLCALYLLVRPKLV